VNTSITKTKGGWQGNTRVDLGNDLVLRITTMRGVVLGGVGTDAIVHRIERVHGYAMEKYTRHDYHKRVIQWDNRATEKNVRAQHQLALDMLDQIKAEIEQHYAK
jgi:hypothetical protein